MKETTSADHRAGTRKTGPTSKKIANAGSARTRKSDAQAKLASAPSSAKRGRVTVRTRVVEQVVSRTRVVSIDEFVKSVQAADPMQLIDAERERVPGVRVMDFAKLMGIRKQRMARMLGVLESTSAHEPAAGELLTRSEGWAALGMARLLGIAKEIVDESTAPAAKGFDSAKWLGRWLEQPQPALGGRKPSELIDTPTGFDVVARLLGSMASGAYS